MKRNISEQRYKNEWTEYLRWSINNQLSKDYFKSWWTWFLEADLVEWKFEIRAHQDSASDYLVIQGLGLTVTASTQKWPKLKLTIFARLFG